MVGQFLGKVDDKTTCLFLLPKLNLSQPAKQGKKQSTYVKHFTDFGFSQTKATLLYEDNLACVAMSENLVRRKFSRHIDIRKYYVRELVLNGFLKLVCACTKWWLMPSPKACRPRLSLDTARS